MQDVETFTSFKVPDRSLILKKIKYKNTKENLQRKDLYQLEKNNRSNTSNRWGITAKLLSWYMHFLM